MPASHEVIIEIIVSYECDGGRTFTLYEPGQDPKHACELDAGHTDKTADWNAAENRGFCRKILEQKIKQYNCNVSDVY